MFWLDPWTFCSIIAHVIAYLDHSYGIALGTWTKINKLPASYFEITTQNALRCGKLCERQGNCVAVTFDNKDRICYMHDTDATSLETSNSERYMYKTYEPNPQKDAGCDRETQIVVPSATKEGKRCYDIKETTATSTTTYTSSSSAETTTSTTDTITTAAETTTSTAVTHAAELNATITTPDTAPPSSEWNVTSTTSGTPPSPDPPADCLDCGDCYDVLVKGHNVSGAYNITLPGSPTITVFCDQDTDGGGWLVFQRRCDGSENFYRGWVDYEKGFGNLEKEFWIGNTFLATITSYRQYTLRIDLESFESESRYAVYDSFNVRSVSDEYRLDIGEYEGTAGDGMTKESDGSAFTTFDRDNDNWPGNCASEFRGAWWYGRCHEANLNGYYYGGNYTTYADGVCWRHWMGFYYSLRRTEMKIRPI